MSYRKVDGLGMGESKFIGYTLLAIVLGRRETKATFNSAIVLFQFRNVFHCADIIVWVLFASIWSSNTCIFSCIAVKTELMRCTVRLQYQVYLALLKEKIRLPYIIFYVSKYGLRSYVYTS